MNSSTRPFPNELAMCVLENLHDDTEALSSCALVCPDWLDLSRQRLFASLAVKLPPPPSADLIRLPQTIAGLASGTSVRCTYVKTLRIYTPLNRKVEPGVLQSSLLVHLVRKLPKLQSLQLVDVDIVVEEPFENPSLPLNTLEIAFRDRMVQHPFAAAVTALKLFSNIQNLSLKFDYSIEGQKELHLPLPVQRIGHIELEGPLAAILAYRDVSHSDSTITSMSLHPAIGKWSRLDRLGELIQDVASQLVSLALTTGIPMLDYWKSNDSYPSHEQWQVLNLSKCTSLETFTLILDEASFSGASATHAGDSLLHVLSHTAKTARTINFQIGRWPEGCVTVAESIFKPEYEAFWEQLHPILSKFPKLTEIEFWFVISESEFQEQWRASIEKYMSSHHVKGSVSIKLRYDLAPSWARV